MDYEEDYNTSNKVEEWFNRIITTSEFNKYLEDNSILELFIHLYNIHLYNQIDSNLLLELFQLNTSFVLLDLSNTIIDDDNIFYELLTKNTNLTSLNLNNTSITDLTKISEGLIKNNSLTELNLGNNNISELKPLSDVLYSNTSLTFLDLSCNKDLNEEVCYIAESLLVNTTLTKLDLCNMSISDVKIFEDVLKCNTTLTSLNLINNEIYNINPIIKGLQYNTTLLELNLSCNCIKIEYYTQLADVLKNNTVLTSLDLSGNENEDLLILNQFNRKFIGDNSFMEKNVITLFSEIIKFNTTLIELEL